MNCIPWHELKFCEVNGVYIVGDNSTASKNGLADSSKEPEILIIPPSIEKNEIKEIGNYSFDHCTSIREVIIEAPIVQVNHHAFFGCCNIEKIYVPNTCKYLLLAAFDLYNETSKSDMSIGTVKIFFAANSKISLIASHGISYRENVIIYTCEAIKPIIENEAFKSVSSIQIVSPVSFRLSGIRSHTKNYFSQCNALNVCTRIKSNHSPSHLSMIIVLIYS